MLAGLIIFGIASVLFLIVSCFAGFFWLDSKRDHEYLGIFSFCVFFTICFACVFSGFMIEYSRDYQKETPIVSLSKDSETSGSFFIGTGTIKETRYYFFYVDLGDKHYTEGHVRVADVVLIETDDVKPCLLITKEKWAFNEKVELYVPIGTIVKEFKV